MKNITFFILFFCAVGILAAQEEEITTNSSFYLEQAQKYYLSAQKKFEIGEYDQSADDANMAKEYAEQYKKSLKLKNQFLKALRLIDEADILISQARSLKATESDLLPSIEKLDEARNYYNLRNFESAIFAAEESINLTKDLIAKLRDTASKKLASETEGWKTYKVRLIPQRRDCLWRIAEYDFIYNDPWKWPAIWKANKEQIVDPDLIYPGQILKIPPLSVIEGK